MALWINSEYVDDATFLAEFRRLGGLEIDQDQPAAELEATRLRRLVEQRVLARTLLRQRAVRQGLTVTAEDIEVRRAQQWGTSSASVCGAGVQQTLREELLVQKYCDWLSRHVLRPSRREVQDLYEERREQFRVGEQVKLMQVTRNIYLPGDEENAWMLLQVAERELLKGVPFQKVADQYSDCGSKAHLGWTQRGEMVGEFEDVAFGLAKGERSGIFRTVFGLHIILALEKKPPGYLPFEEVRSTLTQELLQLRRDRRINAEVAEAIQGATIAFAPSGQQGKSAHTEVSSRG